MEAKWLEDFLSVARTGNFSQSAGEMHITQSAFSRRIKTLEQWVGVALIDRSTYPTRLTPAGERFRDAARDATAALLKTRQDLRQALNADRRLLRIAIQHSLAASFLVPWLTRLRMAARVSLACDDLLVRAIADNLHDCVRELEEGSADFLVCYTQPELPLHLDATRYPSMALADDALVAVSRPDAAGQALHAVRFDMAAAVPWLAYSEGTFLSRAASLALQRPGQVPSLKPVFESALAEALRAGAVAGLGVAWLPHSLAADDLERGVLVRAGGPEFDVGLQICLYAERSAAESRLKRLWQAAQALADAGSVAPGQAFVNHDLSA